MNTRRVTAIVHHPGTRWVISLTVLACLLLIYRDRLPFIGEGIAQLTGLDPLHVGLALLSAIAALVAMGEVLRRFMLAAHVPVTHTKSWGLVFSANAWYNSFPGGAAFSMLLNIRTLSSWGAGGGVIGWFLVLSGALSTMWLVTLGLLAVVFLGANLHLLSSIFSLGITLAVMCILGGLLFWATTHPDTLLRWTRPIDQRTRIDLAHHIHQLSSVTLTRANFARAGIWSLMNWLFDMATLWFCVSAVTHASARDLINSASGATLTSSGSGSSITLAAVCLAFVSAKIAGTVQITPGGLGPVEAAMLSVLVAAGMTASDGFTAVFCYRLISLVFITALGWLIYFSDRINPGYSPRTDPHPEERV